MDVTITEYLIRHVVVCPHGSLDAESAPDLRERLTGLHDEGVRQFLVDLSHITFMDSAGLTILVALLKQVHQGGGEVRLVWPRVEAARRILHQTRFDRIFNTAESAEEAWGHL